MTERRMNKLLCELNLPENSVYIPNTDSILKGVKSKIEVPQRRVNWGMSFSRAVVFAAIVVLTFALTLVAFGKDGVFYKIITIFEEQPTEVVIEETQEGYVDNDSWGNVPIEEITEEETEIQVKVQEIIPVIEEEEEEPERDVYGMCESDDYVFTVNEVIGNSKNLYITLSLEAKSSAAKMLLLQNGGGWFNVEAYNELSGWQSVTEGIEEKTGEKRDGAISYTIHIVADNSIKKGYKELRVSCNAMGGDEYVYIEPMAEEGVVEFELSGQPFTGGYVYITPMSIEIVAPKETTAEYAPEARNLNVFFRFKNGMVKTFNQVAGFDGGFSYVGGASKLYKVEAGARSTINTDNLESVIVKGIEYPIDNPSGYFAADVSEKYKSFVIMGEGKRVDEYHYICSINQLEPCIDITNEEFGIVEFNFGGRSYRVEAGNLTVVINSKSQYNLNIPPYADENGVVWVGSDFLNYLLGIRYDEIAGTGTYLMVP